MANLCTKFEIVSYTYYEYRKVCKIWKMRWFEILRGHSGSFKLECGLMPNVMAALPNIGGALCLMPQSLADDHY